MALTMTPYVDIQASIETATTYQNELHIKGIRTWKLKEDLKRYEEIILISAPEVVVETGTKWGGSALWFVAQGLDVITVDRDQSRSQMARQLTDKVTWIVGNSADSATWKRIHEATEGKRVMVTLDSDHHKDHVMREIRMYQELVSVGCYLVVEDTIYDLMGAQGRQGGKRIPKEGGPMVAVKETLAAQEEPHRFLRDGNLEAAYQVSHHPGGWWVRARQ